MLVGTTATDPDSSVRFIAEGTKSDTAGSDDVFYNAIDVPSAGSNASNKRIDGVVRVPSTGAALPPGVAPSQPGNPDDANPPTALHSCNSPPVSHTETKPHGVTHSSTPHHLPFTPTEIPQPLASSESISASTGLERAGARDGGGCRVETDGGIRLAGGPPDEEFDLEEGLSETGTLPPPYRRY